MNDINLEKLKKIAIEGLENLLKTTELTKEEFGNILKKEAGEENKNIAERFANFEKAINAMVEPTEISRFHENCGKFIGIVQKRKSEIKLKKIRNEFEQEGIRKQRVIEQLQFLKDDSKNPQGNGNNEDFVDSNKKNDIDKIESLLMGKKGKVSEDKLNKRLGTNDWKEKIRSTQNSLESQRQRFDIEDTIEELSKEIICDCCGKTKSPIIDYAIPNKNKVFCSSDCKDTWSENNEEKGTSDKWSGKKRNQMLGVGGIIILALIFVLIVWLFLRKNKQQEY